MIIQEEINKTEIEIKELKEELNRLDNLEEDKAEEMINIKYKIEYKKGYLEGLKQTI